MPILDGYETTAKIRELEEATGVHIPIIALTANALSDEKESCLAAGMDDFVSKPFKSEVLAEAILRVVGPSDQDLAAA